MAIRILARMMLLGGLALIAAGAYGRREFGFTTSYATVGLIALIAAGFFTAIVGVLLWLREPAASEERAARRNRILGRFAWSAVLPPLVAGALMITFFGLTDHWSKLNNPIASQVALAAGVLGALTGILADRITHWELVIIPIVLLGVLLAFGDRLPLDSESTSRSEIVAMLSIAIILLAVVANIPQIIAGQRRRDRSA